MLIENIKSSWREITKGTLLNVLILSTLIIVNTLLLFDIILDPSSLSYVVMIFVGYASCAYFIYLSFSVRTKEISMRKVLGADRPDLYIFVATETFIYMLVSGLIGVVIVEQLSNYLIPLPDIDLSHLAKYMIVIFGMSLLVSLFPFFKLNSINPVNTFRSSESLD